MTNPLKHKYLKVLVVGALALMVGASCHHPKTDLTPEATAPFPVSSLAGRDIGVLPFTLVLADDSLHWEQLADRAKSLPAADSVLWASLTTRITEVPWKSPAHIWRSTRGATGMPDDPRQLGTSILRGVQVGGYVPDPLRAQLRTLGAVAGGTFILAPAALFFTQAKDSGSVKRTGKGQAEVILVLVDVRLGQVSWRSAARGQGDDPWTALTHALKTLTPGLP